MRIKSLLRWSVADVYTCGTFFSLCCQHVDIPLDFGHKTPLKKKEKVKSKPQREVLQRNFFHHSDTAEFPAKSERRQSENNLEEGYDAWG